MSEVLYPIEELSPYDNSYPIKLLSNNITQKVKQAEAFAKDIFDTIIDASSIAVQIYDSMKTDFRFVVDMTEETKKAIANGDIKLSVENGKKLYAQIRQANGRYGEKLPIKREDFHKEIDPVQMVNALQMMALQEQLEKMSYQIDIIDRSVKDVLQGQQNDRIAQYYSGLSLYLESQNIYDSELKKMLLAQSLKALSEATFTLTMQIKSDIKYLVDREYKKKVQLMDERICKIHQSFEVIHLSALLRAGIYCEHGELLAMASVLNEYSMFIENTIARNAHMLSQCDVKDKDTLNGIWSQRAQLKLDVKEITHHLQSSNKTLYLSVAKENE